jgi:HK97 family phage major capsid protein
VKYSVRTGVTNAVWVSEIGTRTGSEPGFGQKEIPTNEVATFVDISNQLLEDTAGRGEQEVRLALAEDFGAKEGTAFVSGNGVGKPEGFMAASGVLEVNSGAATTITADALIDAMYKLPAAFRTRGTWCLNGVTLAAVRKMKDGNGQYLWQPGLQAGQPETILGRPLIEALDMPDLGAGLYPIAFGDFNAAYRIVDRVQLQILVDPYTQAAVGTTRIHARRRVGGGVINAAALVKIKCSL